MSDLNPVAPAASNNTLDQLKSLLSSPKATTGGRKRHSRKHTKKCGGNLKGLTTGGRHKKHHKSRRHRKHHKK